MLAQNVSVAVTAESQANQSVSAFSAAAFTSTVDTLQPIANFQPGSASGVNATIKVDNTSGNQQIDGFGANFSDLTAYLMTNYMTSTQQSAFLQSLFSPTTGFPPTPSTGFGFNVVLTAIGANDQVFRGCYGNPEGNVTGCGTTRHGTLDDNNGVADPSLLNFNIGTPTAYNGALAYDIPQTQAALGVNPGLHIIASAYYQPQWEMMPETQSGASGCGNNPAPLSGSAGAEDGLETLSDGSNSSYTNYYPTAAQYFVKYVQAYEGTYHIPIWAVTPQNEPCIPAANQAGVLTPTQALTLLRGTYNSATGTYVNGMYPAFQAAGLNTQLLPEVNDYNSDNNYVSTLMQDPVLAPELLGVAWHGYAGGADAGTVAADATITQTNNNLVHVNQYQTEYGAGSSETMPDNFDYQAEQPIAGLQNGLKVWMWHALANNQNDDVAGGCNGAGSGTCAPLVEITDNTGSPEGTVTQGQSAYIMKHFSRYIHPGAYIVNSSSSNSSFDTVAARNPDGSTALVVLNYDQKDASQTIGVNWGERYFTYTMPSYSLATFLWPGVQQASNTEIDDSPGQLSYSGTGWNHNASCGSYTNCYGGTVSIDINTSPNTNDYASTSFQVSGPSYVNIYGGVGPGGAGPGGGSGTVSIGLGGANGTPVAVSETSTSTATASTGAGDTLIYSTPSYAPLSAGTYNLKIANTSPTVPFVLDRIEIVTPMTTTVDDTTQGSGSNEFNYLGSGWTSCTSGCANNPYGGTYHTDSTAGDSFTFTYTGFGVTLYFVTGPGQGYANVSIDNSPPVKIDTYSNTANGNQVAWVSPASLTSSGLTSLTKHVVTVSVAGSKGAYGSGTAVTIDRAEFSTNGGGSTNQTISFPSIAATATYGSSLTLGASASSGLPISYTTTGPGIISGSTVTFDGVGSVAVTASQSGNSTYATATPLTHTVSVSPATLSVTGSCAARLFDTPNTCSASVSGYQLNDTAGIVFSGTPTGTSTATPISNAGSYIATPLASSETLLVANYTLNQVSTSFQVTGGVPQNIVFAPLPNFAHGSSYQLSARPTSGLAPTYTITAGNGIASVSGNTLTVTGTGPVTVQASQAGNSNYAAASAVSRSFTGQ